MLCWRLESIISNTIRQGSLRGIDARTYRASFKDGGPFLASFRTGGRRQFAESPSRTRRPCLVPLSLVGASTAEVVVCHLCSMGNTVLQLLTAFGGPCFLTNQTMKQCRAIDRAATQFLIVKKCR